MIEESVSFVKDVERIFKEHYTFEYFAGNPLRISEIRYIII